MNDEDGIRSLLGRAAELPDVGSAPVDHLIAVGRRRLRWQRFAAAAVSAALVLAASAAVPEFIHGSSRPGLAPSAPSGEPPFAATLAGLESDRWLQLPNSPLTAFEPGCGLDGWTGRELLVATVGCRPGFSAVAYVPGAGWRSVPDLPRQAGDDVQEAFFAGGQLVLLLTAPGHVGRPYRLAAIYSPVAESWFVTDYPLTPLPPASADIAAAELGGKLIVTQSAPGSDRVQAASYDLASRSWRRLAVPLPAVRHITGLNMVAAGARLLLWVSWSDAATAGLTGETGVAVRALSTSGSWQVVDGWPQDLVNFTAASALGGQIFIQARPQKVPAAATAYLANSATLRLRAVPGGAGALMAPAIWTGAAVIAVSTVGQHLFGAPTILGRIEALSPADGRWHRLRAGPAEQVALPAGLSPVWTGSQLFIPDGRRLWVFGTG